MSKSVLVTGAAGFIGFHVVRRLLAGDAVVVGVDNINDYYDVRLKSSRVALLEQNKNFEFIHCDISNRAAMAQIFSRHSFTQVIHLAAQAGVGYSAENPAAYVDSNLVGFGNILEGCRHAHSHHLLYASSSSVYGGSKRMPLSVTDRADEPLSLYGATKRANELMAYAYAHAYGLPATGLRFFTAYGPWGRPDMAVWLFTKAILDGRSVRLFNHGKMRRDFTYIDDVVEAVFRLIEVPPVVSGEIAGLESSESRAPHRVFNVGNSQPIEVLDLVEKLERVIGKRAKRELLPMRPVDVLETFSDSSDLQRAIGFRPNTPIDEGLRRFVEWLCRYENSGM